MKEYRSFISFLKPHTKILISAVSFMAISSLFDWVSIAMIVPVADKVLNNGKIIFPVNLPAPVRSLIETINSMPQIELLRLMVLFLPGLFLLKGLFNFLYSYFMSNIGQLCVRDVRNSVYEKFQGLSLEYFTHKRTGELISRITNDVKLVENALSYGVTDLAYQSFQVILFTFTIFYINWKLAAMAFLLIPLIGWPIVKVGKILRKISKRSQEKMADINSLLVETISGARIVKAFCMEDYETNKFKAQNQGYYKLSMKSIKRTLVLSPATEFIGVMCGVTILAWVGKDVIAGSISFGVFGLFLGSLFSLIRPLKKLSQVNSINQQALAANTRIYEVLNAPITVREPLVPIELRDIKEKIEFKNINFWHGQQKILEHINLSVSKGGIIAIVGPSGAGKSTLVDLIPRFYDPQEGAINIDNIDVRNFSLKSLRSKIGMVTQEIILFNDTIKANISYGHLEADMEKVRQAARQANAHDFIVKFPDGYNSMIGDRGVKLSGGERQRIAIARALLKDPPILILDEATSHLDSHSERLVQDAMDRLIQGRTVFIVAHRLATIKNASKVIVIDKGRIIQAGTHQQLLEEEGLYRKLYEMQNLDIDS